MVAQAPAPPAIAGSPVRWLLTIARNALIDSYRRGRAESAARQRLALEPVQITDSDIERVLQVAAETDLLVRLADELPADRFHALRARVRDERGYEEIARELAWSPAVVCKRVSNSIFQTLLDGRPFAGENRVDRGAALAAIR